MEGDDETARLENPATPVPSQIKSKNSMEDVELAERQGEPCSERLLGQISPRRSGTSIPILPSDAGPGSEIPPDKASGSSVPVSSDARA